MKKNTLIIFLVALIVPFMIEMFLVSITIKQVFKYLAINTLFMMFGIVGSLWVLGVHLLFKRNKKLIIFFCNVSIFIWSVFYFVTLGMAVTFDEAMLAASSYVLYGIISGAYWIKNKVIR